MLTKQASTQPGGSSQQLGAVSREVQPVDTMNYDGTTRDGMTMPMLDYVDGDRVTEEGTGAGAGGVIANTAISAQTPLTPMINE